MNTKKLLALWGLKWNPFAPELPGEGLLVTPRIEHFAWRVEQLVQEGGFALISGESGTGKSVALRIVAARLSALRQRPACPPAACPRRRRSRPSPGRGRRPAPGQG